MNEFEFIEKLLRPIVNDQGSVGLTDDVAILTGDSGTQIITTDTLVEGRHFRVGDPWISVGQKLVRVNVSDCLAKAAYPKACLFNLTWNTSGTKQNLIDLITGLKRDLDRYAINLIGGDTTSHQAPCVLSLTLIGVCGRPEGPVRRSGAMPGSDIWMTGNIGESYLGLSVKDNTKPGAKALQDRFLVPELADPVIVQALERFAEASMDISDGLIADAGHMAKASNLMLEIDIENVPVSEAARRYLGGDLNTETRLRLCNGGDDYQVLFTAKTEHRDAVSAFAETKGLKLTRIGRTRVGEGVQCSGPDGKVLKTLTQGWQHQLSE